MTTKRGVFRRLALILGMTTMILAVGCGGAKKKEDGGEFPQLPQLTKM